MPKSTLLQSGEKFGRLTVIKLDHIEKYTNPTGKLSRNEEFYLCTCDCGNECIILKQSLKLGYTKSCGCLQKERTALVRLNTKKHGLKNTRLYNIFNGIKQRCYNKKDKHFKNYGNRGITMCEEWKNDFKVFYDWSTNNGYNDSLTIDRIDVNGNYEPNNCRWTTIKEQQRNRTNNRLITYNNETHCVGEWSEKLNLKGSTIYNRINSNWSVEKAFYKPIKFYKNINQYNKINT